MKKFFTVGMAVILGASLSFFGCESATGAAGAAGESGAPGANVGFINTTSVTDTELAALFKAADIVTLGPDVDDVYGVVPTGKKLAVSGGTAVEDGEVLGIEAGGSVEVYEGASLDASGISGTSGFINGAADSVYGDGVVALPYLTDPDADIGDGLAYNNSTAPNKAAGSVTDGKTYIAPLTAATVKTLLTTVSPLTVYSLTGIAADTVPSGKELNLLGTGNTAAAAIDLSSAGTLVVKEGAELAVTTYSVKGVTNNGTITSTATVAATQKDLISENSGTGTVVLGGEGAGAVHTATLTLTQNVTISGTNSKLVAPVVATPFSGDKTITIAADGTLDLGAAVAALSLSGVTIENEGTITTATVSDAALRTIIEVDGRITATGAITALTANLTVPEDVELTANTATLATGAFELKVDGSLSATSATLAEITSLEVNGELTVGDDATLASVTALTVNGELTVGDGVTLAAITTASTEITGTGSITAGAVTTVAAAVKLVESAVKTVSVGGTFEATDAVTIPANTIRTLTGAAAPSGDVTVNGELNISGAAAPAGDVTVSADGTLNVSSTGSLTIVAGKELANNGAVALTGTGKVVLKTNNDTSGGAKLTGTGTLTAQNTEIVGGTGGWTADLTSGSSEAQVTIASTATGGQAEITGAADTALIAGTGATITQKAGTSDNQLSLAANTVINLAGTGTVKAGEITLESGDDPGKLVFAATSSKVLAGAGAGGSAISGTTSPTIGGKAIVINTLQADDFQNASDKLVLIGGTTAGNFTASTAASQDVVINSTVAANGS